MSVRVVRVRRFWAYAREYASYGCSLFGRIAIRITRARYVLYRRTCTTRMGRVGAHTGVTADLSTRRRRAPAYVRTSLLAPIPAAVPAPPSSHSSAYGSTCAPGSGLRPDLFVGTHTRGRSRPSFLAFFRVRLDLRAGLAEHLRVEAFRGM